MASPADKTTQMPEFTYNQRKQTLTERIITD